MNIIAKNRTVKIHYRSTVILVTYQQEAEQQS
jgi:hypothetical protein